mmetsp:Transcript_24761/g.45382  ORF Transcript_24761/g.45382 Transcript_24761/m.45382 type:complete len:283 (-) Transcript_24761:3-851(-)
MGRLPPANESKDQLDAHLTHLASSKPRSEVRLQKADEELRQTEDVSVDWDVVINILAQGWEALEHAPMTLRGDRDFMTRAISSKPWAAPRWQAVQFATEELRNDYSFMCAAVSEDWQAIQWASKTLCCDRNFVLHAVNQDWTAIKFASQSFRGDADVMKAIIAKNQRGLTLAAEELLLNDNFLREVTPMVPDLCICKVSMMSGRQRVIVIPKDELKWFDSGLQLLSRRASGLELDESNLKGAELLIGTFPITDIPPSQWPGLEIGNLLDLQLVCSSNEVDDV